MPGRECNLLYLDMIRKGAGTLKKIGYAMGDMGISISYFALGFFFMFYLTDMVGLSPAAAGIAMFIGKLWDGINDPLMGIISDRTVSRFGRKRVYVLFGSFALAVSFILLWMVPMSAPLWGRFLWATVSLLLYSTAYTVVVVPYMALVPVMSDDYDERTQITSLRAILSSVAIIMGGGVALLLSSFTDQLLGLRLVAVGFGLFTMVSLLIAAASVKGLEEKQAGEKIVPYRAAHYLKLFQERNLRLLLALKFYGAIATGCLTASFPYYAAHVLGNKGLSTLGVASYTIFAAVSIPFWTRLTKKHDKRKLLLIANVLVAVILLWLGLVAQQVSQVLFLAGCALMGTVFAAYLFIPYSFVPDLVEFYEHKTGERHESVFFGLWITVHQLGIAVAGLVLGLGLQFMGYDGSLAVQTPQGILAVRVAFGILPGLFLILAAVTMNKYEITRTVFEQIKLELGQKAKEV
jgi:glycoside/pentoside/hexuronide:cation symporter, GPH family